MTTMKAVRMHAYGDLDVLRYEDAPKPTPAAGEVLIRVHAAGINPVDWKVRRGYLKQMIPYTMPLILGWDVSGTIEAVGPGRTDFAVGDAVFSRPDLTRDGAYAEYVVVRADEVARKPPSIDHIHAAGVPLAALTAWQVLFDAPTPYTGANIAPGQTVLIHAAAGGVGSFAVQLAKWKRARVIGTASASNVEFVRSLGADEVIDYRTTRFEDVVRDVDVVFDTVGGDVQERSWNVLRKGGILVSIVGNPSADRAKAHGARAGYVFVQPSGSQLARIGRLLDEGVIQSVVSKVLPLASAREAHALSEGGHVRGKIVLEVA